MASIDATHRPTAPAAVAEGSSITFGGGWAAIAAAAGNLAGLVMLLGVLPATGFSLDDWDSADKIVPIVRNHLALFSLYDLIVAATALIAVPAVIAVASRLWRQAPGLTATSVAVAVIGLAFLLMNGLVQYAEFQAFASQPMDVSKSVLAFGNVAYDTTSGGAGLGFGLWILLVSVGTIRTRAFPRWLGYLGILYGLVTAAFVLPITGVVAPVLSLPWLIGMGAALIRRRDVDAAL